MLVNFFRIKQNWRIIFVLTSANTTATRAEDDAEEEGADLAMLLRQHFLIVLFFGAYQNSNREMRRLWPYTKKTRRWTVDYQTKCPFTDFEIL